MKKTSKIFLILLSFGVLAACSGQKALPVTSAGAQLEFGSEMAQRGLWNEALFRFEKARDMSPANGRVLNNLAVASEALGDFTQAEALYKRGLEVDPANKDIRQNYDRFRGFYEAYKARQKEAEEQLPPAVADSSTEPETTTLAEGE